jgi:hypothetical protein
MPVVIEGAELQFLRLMLRSAKVTSQRDVTTGLVLTQTFLYRARHEKALHPTG